ncbi:MAG: hypothetical protein RL514_4462 [Verrucomicrobiota bacterium]|jgi:hypothetical protein
MSEGTRKGLWWLASYPKSGNTWTRAFLANLLSGSEQPVDINALETGAIASSRPWVEDALGFDISELNHDEVDALRPAAYRWVAAHTATDYHKIHDAYTYLPDGSPLIPREATCGAVCIIRNPLDVVPSYANHSSISIEQSVSAICNAGHAFCKSPRRQSNQLRQQLLTWSAHVESWLDADLSKLVVRYEDLKAEPVKWFTAITRFLEIDRDEAAIAGAIERARFENLRRQEDEKGFVEKAPKVKNFFRKGQVGGWRGELTEAQVRRVIEANRPAMLRMGYLQANGELAESLAPLSSPA